MPVDNIHNWMWNAQGDVQKRYFDIMTIDENIDSTVELLKSQGNKEHPIHSYKLKGLEITRANQVW